MWGVQGVRAKGGPCAHPPLTPWKYGRLWNRLVTWVHWEANGACDGTGRLSIKSVLRLLRACFLAILSGVFITNFLGVIHHVSHSYHGSGQPIQRSGRPSDAVWYANSEVLEWS